MVELEPWRHGWKNIAEMTYMHGGSQKIISPEATTFAAKNYPIVAFANAYGTRTNGKTFQEDAAIETALALRKVNPSVKNVFYWKVDLESQIKKHSRCGEEWSKHPNWRFQKVKNEKDDRGFMDVTRPRVRKFWKKQIILMAGERDEENDKPLFDGFFLDGMCVGSGKKVRSDEETEIAWGEGTRTMTKELQEELNELGNNQLLIVNGMDTVESVPVMRDVCPATMVDHFGVLQFLNRKKGEDGSFKEDLMKELLFDVCRAPETKDMTLIIKAWPGPVVKQRSMWPNKSQPTTTEGMRQAARDHLMSALALFLLVAEDTMYFSYSWFWEVGDYIPFGEDHSCPEEFYPMFQYPLGEPLGPPTEVEDGGEYEYTREYEHVNVYVDLKDRSACRVVWKNPEVCLIDEESTTAEIS